MNAYFEIIGIILRHVKKTCTFIVQFYTVKLATRGITSYILYIYITTNKPHLLSHKHCSTLYCLRKTQQWGTLQIRTKLFPLIPLLSFLQIYHFWHKVFFPFLFDTSLLFITSVYMCSYWVLNCNFTCRWWWWICYWNYNHRRS